MTVWQQPATSPYYEPEDFSPLPAYFKVDLNIVLPSTSRSSKCNRSFTFPHQSSACIYVIPHSCHLPSPSYPTWFDHPNSSHNSVPDLDVCSPGVINSYFSSCSESIAWRYNKIQYVFDFREISYGCVQSSVCSDLLHSIIATWWVRLLLKCETLALRGLGFWSDTRCLTLNTVQNAEWGSLLIDVR